MFKVNAKITSLAHHLFPRRKLISDASGSRLFTHRRKRLRPGPTHSYAGTGREGKGRRSFEVKGKYTFGRPKAEEVFFNACTGR